jgi:hypothetical protein
MKRSQVLTVDKKQISYRRTHIKRAAYRANWHIPVQVQDTRLPSECQTSGTCAKRAKQATKKDNAAACLCFLNYLAFLRPAADRAVSILPWVVGPGRSYGFSLGCSIIQKKKMRMDDPTPAYSPLGDRRRLTALVEFHWARRVQAPMPQISGPDLQENHIIETYKREGCAVSIQETVARRK